MSDMSDTVLNKEMTVLDFYDVDRTEDQELAVAIDKSSIEVQKVYNKLKHTIPKLTELGWQADIVPLKLSHNGVYWSDYPYDYLKEKHGDTYGDKPGIYFVVYLDESGENVNLNKDILGTFDHMNVEMKKKVLTLFYKEMPKNFEWDGNNNKVMTIKYSSNDSIEQAPQAQQVNFDNLRSDDTYPQLSIHFDMKIDLFKIESIDDLNVMKDLKNVLEGMQHHISYGLHDIELEINSVDEEYVYELYNKINGVLDKYENINDKNEKISVTSMTYYVNGNDIWYDLLDKKKKGKRSRGRIKGTKTRKNKEFVDKYKNFS